MASVRKVSASRSAKIRLATIAAGVLAFLLSLASVVATARAGGPSLYENIPSGTTAVKVLLTGTSGSDIGTMKPERLKVENPSAKVWLSFWSLRSGTTFRKAYPIRTTGTALADTTIEVAAGAGWTWPKRISADVLVIHRSDATAVIVTGGDE